MKQWIDEAMHEATGKTNQTRKDTVWKNNKDVKQQDKEMDNLNKNESYT